MLLDFGFPRFQSFPSWGWEILIHALAFTYVLAHKDNLSII